MFYVGNQGQFDAYVHGELKKLKVEYPHINYAGYTPDSKRITGENLYMSYSWKGAKKGHGNFLTYVDRAETEYGPGEAIKRDTRRHMQKIRRALNEHEK